MRSQSRHTYLKDAVDWNKFAKRLARRVAARKLSYRDLAVTLGIPNHMLIYKVQRGEPCSVEVYLWLCVEFGIDPMYAFKGKRP